MKLAAAARALRVALSTAALMSCAGQLDVDPETDSSGARFVTGASVQECWLARHDQKRRRARPTATVPLAEVARFTGESESCLVDLVRTGVLHGAGAGRGSHITVSSLKFWMG